MASWALLGCWVFEVLYVIVLWLQLCRVGNTTHRSVAPNHIDPAPDQFLVAPAL
jgi:hypothetical protein